MSIEKSKRPRTEPCGTPYLRDCTLDAPALTHTHTHTISSLFIRKGVGRVRDHEAGHTTPIFEGEDHGL